ncbi:heme-binding protein [Sphingopyxis sp.]|jgi:uncharacterized protein GlcG (DUF336 family)|uniref:GlcG/HbpS family heme-binding protein n=1 Tax=Sphingopyxis sp. TaxID=1908224 RepID=UPI002DE4EF69|nr:heme-binding protein [Sphingopyxis sp.]
MSGSEALVRAAASVNGAAAASLVEAAIGAALDGGFEASVAVVDNAGVLRSFARTDGAPFLTVDIAIGKAWTAVSLGYPSHVWNQLSADPAFAPLARLPRVVAVGGGYPLRSGGMVVGAIGVSGGTTQQDQDAAIAAMRGVGFDVG